MTILLTIVVTAVTQVVKMFTRMFGVSKDVATYIVYALLFVLVFLFTGAQQFPALMEKILFFGTVLTGSIGTYELFLNKTGLDSAFKNLVDIKRDVK